MRSSDEAAVEELLSVRHWLSHDSSYVHRDRWIKLRADECETPEGVDVSPYYVLELPDWVHVVAFDERGRLLVTSQYRRGLDRVCIELPGGVLEPDEPPRAGAARELLEETGCSGGEWVALPTMSPNPATHANLVHGFLVTNVRRTHEPQAVGPERVQSRFLELASVLELIDRGAFPQAMHVCTLMLALRRLKRFAGGP